MPALTAIFIAVLFVKFSTLVLGNLGVEIAFIPYIDPTCRYIPWEFTRLQPTGCHSASPEYDSSLGHIRLRTAYPYLEDIPDAIAIYDGDCIRSNVTLVMFPYKLQYVDQELHIAVAPKYSEIDYPDEAKYRVLKEGSLEWKKILGSKPPLPTNEGDVLYKGKDGQWSRLPNEIMVYRAREWGRPLTKTFDIYQKGVGVRPEPLIQPSRFENLNMRLGTLERQFPNSPDSVLVRPRLGDDDDQLPGWLSDPQTRRDWAGAEENLVVPQQRKDPLRCGGQPIRYKNSLTEMTEQRDAFEKGSPGFRLSRNNPERSPLRIPSTNPGTIGLNKLRVPNPQLPKVQMPSGFSQSQSRSQSPDDFGWDVLRPQRGHRIQDPTPNYLGERLRESAEKDESISEIPDELSPGEKIRVNLKETEYDPILAGLTSSALPSEFQPMDSLSPMLPLLREPGSPSVYPDESSDPRVNAIILNSNPDFDSQYFYL
ncbi:hypothetical protein TWF506_011115 [Arthrobotrys conoides]|uniref:Uncharacterized protein n=1 Tax=Arthrobotrys conoides TaxID=74498 RepID=A0AAN8RKB1_9PEZI